VHKLLTSLGHVSNLNLITFGRVSGLSTFGRVSNLITFSHISRLIALGRVSGLMNVARPFKAGKQISSMSSIASATLDPAPAFNHRQPERCPTFQPLKNTDSTQQTARRIFMRALHLTGSLPLRRSRDGQIASSDQVARKRELRLIKPLL
jgi:hypothetical protein